MRLYRLVFHADAEAISARCVSRKTVRAFAYKYRRDFLESDHALESFNGDLGKVVNSSLTDLAGLNSGETMSKHGLLGGLSLTGEFAIF